MSRGLLKRAVDLICSHRLDDASYVEKRDADVAIQLREEINEYLSRPDKDPVGWMFDVFNDDRELLYSDFNTIKPSNNPVAENIRPIYTSAPEQKPITIDEIIAAWNTRADQYNQWDSLDADERVNFVLRVVNANALTARKPFTDDEREDVFRKATESHRNWTKNREKSSGGQCFVQKDYFHNWLIIETEVAHGITDPEQSKPQSNAI